MAHLPILTCPRRNSLKRGSDEVEQQPNASQSLRRHLPIHRLGDDIARREGGARNLIPTIIARELPVSAILLVAGCSEPFVNGEDINPIGRESGGGPISLALVCTATSRSVDYQFVVVTSPVGRRCIAQHHGIPSHTGAAGDKTASRGIDTTRRHCAQWYMHAQNNSFPEKLSYDDVLLVPGFADFIPAQTDVSVQLAPNIRLTVPVISAAMDTVTEEQLAIALALEGGVGVIHRNMSAEEQAKQVANVKRFLNWVIESPVTVGPQQTVGEIRDIMEFYSISGLPVIEADRLVGIITSRDLRFAPNDRLHVRDVMTANPIVEVGTPTIESAQAKFNEHKIEKLPVVDENGRLTGLITVKDMEKHSRFPNAATDPSGRLLVGAALAPNDTDERLEALVAARVDFVVVDTAHGDSKNVIEAIRRIKGLQPALPVVGGNVATREGTQRLIEAGADIVKVGVGPGSICTTRIVAGIGVPQLSAVLDAVAVAQEHGIPVIADGGIKFSGDLTKALAAGAHAVMIGNLFAGLKEAPGREFLYEGRIFKSYRGMGSVGAMKRGGGERYNVAEGEEPVPEGIEGRVPYKGELKPFLHQLVTGLRKGMGYCGCRTLAELRRYRNFVKITPAGLSESHVHDVAIVQEPANYSRG